MKLEDIVTLKKSSLMGEVLAIDELDKAQLKLCDLGVTLWADIADLVVSGANQPQRESGKIVHILGTAYKIIIVNEDDYRYKRDADGWCDFSTKEIFVYNFTQDIDSKRDLVAYQNKVIRHEIIHAFLYESGLESNSLSTGAWAANEEMVDWMAIQIPKIYKAYKEAGAAEEV